MGCGGRKQIRFSNLGLRAAASGSMKTKVISPRSFKQPPSVPLSQNVATSQILQLALGQQGVV